MAAKVKYYSLNKIFGTAYARRNLWDDILSVGGDYIYSDTDSIKLTNYEAHKDYFENYNKMRGDYNGS